MFLKFPLITQGKNQNFNFQKILENEYSKALVGLCGFMNCYKKHQSIGICQENQKGLNRVVTMIILVSVKHYIMSFFLIHKFLQEAYVKASRLPKIRVVILNKHL